VRVLFELVYQRVLLKHTSRTTVVSLLLLIFSPYIKPDGTSRPPGLLKISPCLSHTPLFSIIVIVHSSYLSCSKTVDSQGLQLFTLKASSIQVSQAIDHFFISRIIILSNILTTLRYFSYRVIFRAPLPPPKRYEFRKREQNLNYDKHIARRYPQPNRQSG